MPSKKKYISIQLRKQVAKAANFRCGYCLFPQVLMGMPLTVDHIIPEAQGGKTVEENLWLACRRCNDFKGVQITAVDPQTSQIVSLFNPCNQEWWEHFQWSEDGVQIVGKTPCGRATVQAMQLNNDEIVVTRQMWVSAGWWPPLE